MEVDMLHRVPEAIRDDLMRGRIPVVPGTRLWPAEEQIQLGNGTYQEGGQIYSSLVGFVKLTFLQDNRMKLEVAPAGGGAALAKAGDVVTAIVARVTPRGARCELRCAGERPLSRPLRAHLAKENVYDVNKDRVDMYKCFKPGDIILAKVLPVTSLNSYELTTAEPELGVVIARAADSPPGVNMVPLSWSEMQCPVTLAKQPRKVAKVVPDNIYELMQGRLVKSNSESVPKR